MASDSGFTGTFWGICCQDMTGDNTWADFDYFDYRNIELTDETGKRD
ncbi:MAG: hypothetical protein QGH29_02795 [Kiritimatiellia bacterium]|nr:hypothetical protein [Kiritimatiellia bacterium]